MKKLLGVMLLFLSLQANAVTPPWVTDTRYSDVKYFINLYTRQYDGVWLGAITSTDSLRLGGQLPAYYATATNLSSEITNRQNADINIGVSTGTLATKTENNRVDISTMGVQVNNDRIAIANFKVSPSTGILAGTLASNVIASSIAVQSVGIQQLNTNGKIWQIIYSSYVTQGAISTFTITGLNGDVDTAYKLSVFVSSVATAASNQPRLRINGDARALYNYMGMGTAGTTTAYINASLQTQIILGLIGGAAETNFYTIELEAHTGNRRPFKATYSQRQDSSSVASYNITGNWNDGATNITSLQIDCTVAGTYGNGSWVRLETLK